MKDCNICRGASVIRLPIYGKLSALPQHVEPTVSIEETSRTYPCPECAATTSIDRVRVVEAGAEFSSEPIGDPGYRPHIERRIADELAQEILKAGLIEFRTGPTDRMTRTFAMRGTVGLVSRNDVATLEERIAERQAEVAREVVEAAKTNILVWGSHFGSDKLYKAQAIDSVNEALRAALDKRRT